MCARRVMLVALTLWFVAATPTSALCSAGGFSGGSAGGGAGAGVNGIGAASTGADASLWWLVASVAAIILVSWLAVMSVFLWKGALARIALSRAPSGATDSNPELLSERARHVFRAVQRAWGSGDLSSARECMSERLGYELDDRLADMKRRGRTNLMDRVEVKDAIVVGVRLCAHPQDDRVWVWLEASLIDCVVSERTGQLVEGDAKAPRDLREIWSFTRSDTGWVVDEINQRPRLWAVALLPLRVEGASGA